VGQEVARKKQGTLIRSTKLHACSLCCGASSGVRDSTQSRLFGGKNKKQQKVEKKKSPPEERRDHSPKAEKRIRNIRIDIKNADSITSKTNHISCCVEQKEATN
jgi:hypothetical protein